MKHLTLIRHAKSGHDDPTLRDFVRPLNDRGRRDAPKMGRHLRKEFNFSPDCLISSPATRALTTARAIAAELGENCAPLQQDERIYEAPVSILLEVLREVDDSRQHVCMVGHNPGMENLTNWLAGERTLAGFVTCGVAMLELDISSWEKLRKGCGKLVHFLAPRELWDVDED